LLDISDNSLLDAYIDLSAFPNLTTLHVQNNILNYDDLRNLSVPSSVQFTYAPQEFIATERVYEFYIGLDQSIYSDYAGAGADYMWSKDGMNLGITTNTNVLELTNLQASDAGDYFVAISHTDFPNLLFASPYISLILSTARERDSLALVQFYENVIFKNNEWDLTQPMDNWYGVTLSSNGGVTRLEIPNTLEGGTIDYFNRDL